MKLLFDENLSHRLVDAVARFLPRDPGQRFHRTRTGPGYAATRDLPAAREHVLLRNLPAILAAAGEMPPPHIWEVRQP